MIRLLFALFIVGLWHAPAYAPIVRYTTSTVRGATGTTCSTGSRCTVAYALSQSSASDTVSLESNTTASPFVYQGANDMIAPSAGRSGTSGSPITVLAETDGGVILDGQFARIPINLLSGNNWWIIEGINAKNGTTSVVSVLGNDNIVRRVVAWDAQFSNATRVLACQSTGARNLFEDVAGFGIGTGAIAHSQDQQGPCTFRRAWGRFEGTANGTNGATTMGYLFYNSIGATCENCLGEYWANGAPLQYTVFSPTPTSESGCPSATCTDGAPPNPNGAVNINRYDGDGNFDGQILGSIMYARAAARLTRMSSGNQGTLLAAPAGREGGGLLFKDVIFVVDPAHTLFSSMRGFNLGSRITTFPSTITSTSTISGLTNPVDTSYWIASDNIHGTNLTALNTGNANPWTGSAGANLCHRYVNRARTSTPLWPWPMNQRIKDATGTAGAYSGPCQGCIGTFPMRTAVDVMADIEKLLGPIPAACRR
jgi:hypothetical protein